jgi:hypothetical protein
MAMIVIFRMSDALLMPLEMRALTLKSTMAQSKPELEPGLIRKCFLKCKPTGVAF